MISHFFIEGFKRFAKDTSIQFDDVTVLIGANNSGKSTLLQALIFFQNCIRTTWHEGSGSFVEQSALPADFGPLPVAIFEDLWTAGDVTNTIRICATYESGYTIEFKVTTAHGRIFIEPLIPTGLRPSLPDIEIRMVPIFSSFVPREQLLDQAQRQDRMRQQQHGQIIRNLLWDLKESDLWDLLCMSLAVLFPDTTLSLDVDRRGLILTWKDDILGKVERDVMTGGAGFHQCLQILASVLAPGTGMALLDEPDAHLHPDRQARLMGVLTELAKRRNFQLVVASHSPHVFHAFQKTGASIRVCHDGAVIPFDVGLEQLRTLDDLGVIDRMQIVPLLRNRVVVFVEGSSDVKFLSWFGDKLWGEQERERLWDLLTFIPTGGSLADGSVVTVARNVREIIVKLRQEENVWIVAVTDRDYRTDESRIRAMRPITTPDGKKIGKVYVWEANEIENYLMDRDAILNVIQHGADLSRCSISKFEKEFDNLIASGLTSAIDRMATRFQHENRGVDLTTAMKTAREHFGRCSVMQHWCDAKDVVRRLRVWLQENGCKCKLEERDIISAMKDVPGDVAHILNHLKCKVYR